MKRFLIAFLLMQPHFPANPPKPHARPKPPEVVAHAAAFP
jgi:hypothetical protein